MNSVDIVVLRNAINAGLRKKKKKKDEWTKDQQADCYLPTTYLSATSETVKSQPNELAKRD